MYFFLPYLYFLYLCECLFISTHMPYYDSVGYWHLRYVYLIKGREIVILIFMSWCFLLIWNSKMSKSEAWGNCYLLGYLRLPSINSFSWANQYDAFFSSLTMLFHLFGFLAFIFFLFYSCIQNYFFQLWSTNSFWK